MRRGARWAATIALLAACVGWADIAPVNTFQCRGKEAGSRCTLEEGGAGVCQEGLVTRPDYSNGPPPTYRQVKMMICVPVTKQQASAPWALAIVALGAAVGSIAVRLRRGPALPSPRST